MMFLYNNSTETAKTGQPWRKFELESLESHALSGKGNKTDFIQLETPDTEKDNFIPFEKGGNNPKKIKEAEDILQKAMEKAVYIEQEAYEKGFAQGEKDGLELGGKKAIKLIENIESILIELKQLKEEIPKQYEKEILDLIFVITKKIIYREIASDETALKDTILNALHFAVEKSKVILSVNPEDFNYVEKLRTQLFAEVKDLKSISISSDPSITRGGCFLETPHGDIDSTVETQLKKIYQSLEDAFDEKGS
jgi:flagellar assembly protein FliH